MPAIPTPDVIGQALVTEAIPSVAVRRTPEQTTALNLAKKAQEGKFREGLQDMRAPAIDLQQAMAKIEQIGVERDATTGQKVRLPAVGGARTPEQVRYATGKNNIELAFKLAETGYDGLQAVEQRQVREKVLKEAFNEGRIAQQLRGLNPGNPIDPDNPALKAYAERLLKEPAMRIKIREAFLSRQQADRFNLGSAAEDLQDEVAKAEAIKKTAEDDVQELRRRQQRLDASLKLYKRNPDGSAATGATEAAKLDLQRAQLPTLRKEADDFQKKLENANDRLRRLKEERDYVGKNGPRVIRAGTRLSSGRTTTSDSIPRDMSVIDGEIGALQKEVDTYQESLHERKTKMQELADLEDREKAYKADKKEVDDEKKEKDHELKLKEIALAGAKRKLGDALRLRESQEQALVTATDTIIAEGVASVLKEQVDDLNKTFLEEVATLKDQAKTQQEKAMYEALERRWQLPAETRYHGFTGWVLGREETHRPIDREQVNRDYDSLLSEGPEAVMLNLLQTQVNPDNPPTLYTADQAREILNNKEYIEKMQPEVVKQLLAKRIMTNGINREDVQVIVTSQWGKGMITEAMNVRKEFRDAVNQLMGENALGGRGFWDKFGTQAGKHPWLMLLLIGLPIAAVKALNMHTGDYVG